MRICAYPFPFGVTTGIGGFSCNIVVLSKFQGLSDRSLLAIQNIIRNALVIDITMAVFNYKKNHRNIDFFSLLFVKTPLSFGVIRVVHHDGLGFRFFKSFHEPLATLSMGFSDLLGDEIVISMFVSEVIVRRHLRNAHELAEMISEERFTSSTHGSNNQDSAIVIFHLMGV